MAGPVSLITNVSIDLCDMKTTDMYRPTNHRFLLVPPALICACVRSRVHAYAFSVGLAVTCNHTVRTSPTDSEQAEHNLT